MSEVKVFDALQVRLASLVMSPVMKISWPGINFTPPVFTPPVKGGYLRASFLPADSFQLAISSAGSKVRHGIFQVSVFWVENDGLSVPLTKADAVAAHFAKGTMMDRQGVRVRVEDPPRIGASLQESGWIQVPVSIPYWAST